MSRFFYILLFSLVILAGCRAKKEVRNEQTHSSAVEVGWESHQLAGFWDSIASKYAFRVEFYPPAEGEGTPLDSSFLALAPAGLASVIGGGKLGQIKSIEVNNETSIASSSLTQADSTTVFKTATTEANSLHIDKETRQDNGTVATVAIVLAVAFLVYVMLRMYFKR